MRIGEGDQILDFLHIEGVCLESMQYEHEVEGLVGFRVPQTILTSGQQRMILLHAGRIYACPRGRVRRQGGIRLISKHFAKKREKGSFIGKVLRVLSAVINEARCQYRQQTTT